MAKKAAVRDCCHSRRNRFFNHRVDLVRNKLEVLAPTIWRERYVEALVVHLVALECAWYGIFINREDGKKFIRRLVRTFSKNTFFRRTDELQDLKIILEWLIDPRDGLGLQEAKPHIEELIVLIDKALLPCSVR